MNKYLALLADALEKRDPDLFDMQTFAINEAGRDLSPSEVATCGTVCCALGMAPLVDGIPKPLDNESWESYCKRVFCEFFGPEWSFMFGGIWGTYPKHNTPDAAAKRIRHLLKTGEVPSYRDWIEEN